MNFYVLTLFPEMIDCFTDMSILGRAKKENLITVNTINIRDFANNKHKHVDDTPYGGGAGMVMQAPPIYDSYMSIPENIRTGTKVIYLSPQGSPFTQKKAEELSKEENLILLCGHYEGIDERIIEEIVTEEISIGDFVLTGGELGASIIIDSVSRLIKGVLNKEESFTDESFSENLLEYPQYTRPYEFMGKKVPDVLISGHHANIAKWRRMESIKRTFFKRPDLLEKAELSKKEQEFLKNLKNDTNKRQEP